MLIVRRACRASLFDTGKWGVSTDEEGEGQPAVRRQGKEKKVYWHEDGAFAIGE